VMAVGYSVIKDLLDGLQNYMQDKGFEAILDMVGLSLEKLVGQTEHNREMRLISSVKEEACVKCDLCYVSCRDAGYQAIKLRDDRIPTIDKEKCTGCSLCQQVCPVWDCVVMKPQESVRA